MPPRPEAVAAGRFRALCRHVLGGEAAPQLLAAPVDSGVTNRKVVLKNPPQGEPKASDFEIVSEPLPSPGEGEMLLRTKWLSLDPYMRTGEGMASKRALGKTIVGGTVSEVLESRAPGWQKGDLVVGYYGWQEYTIAKATDIQWHQKGLPIEKWDSSLGPASTAVGILGMTGYTAYYGLLEVAKPKAGETVVVSAASGAVGQAVGQLAKIRGCRVVGVAGGARKCAFCVDELGFDACVDYKAGGLPAALKAACPKGIDIYFENVGGEVLEAVIPLLNAGCRVPVCGFISQYNGATTPSNPLQRLGEAGLKVLGKKGSTEGFRFFFWSEPAFLPRLGEAQRELSGWIKEGKLKYRESITQGLDSAVGAFAGLLRGENFGKTLVQVS